MSVPCLAHSEPSSDTLWSGLFWEYFHSLPHSGNDVTLQMDREGHESHAQEKENKVKPFKFRPLEWLANLVAVDPSIDQTWLDEEDLKEVFAEGKKGSKLFLGTYSLEDIWRSLEEYHIIPKLKEAGFMDIVIQMDTSDPWVHRVTVTDRSIQQVCMRKR